MSDDLLDPTPERPSLSRKTGGSGVDASVVQALLRPVSITFLAQVLKMDRKTVTQKLADLEPMGMHRGSTPLYDFRQAMQKLVTPRVNVEEALKRLGTDSLPLSLQKDIWDARLKSQKWLLNAGELWHTSDVIDVLGEAFQRLKTTTQLWIDQIGDSHSLSPEARAELTGLVDALQADMHRSLVQMPQERVTLAQSDDVAREDLDG